MKRFLTYTSGAAVGTLLYTGVLSSEQEFDVFRAVVVGVFAGLFQLAWQGRRKRGAADTAQG